MGDQKKDDAIFQIGTKLWLKGFENFTLGPGDVRLIKSLQKTKNLTRTSEDLGYSYKYGWSKLRSITKKTGRPVVISHKGGYGGGGNVTVTPWGTYLVELFSMVQERLDHFSQIINQEIAKKSFKDSIN
ncbi:winged helix-turn-helix domain-containing protein [Candidatus Lokiarchaeum ossiferum]|uniref:winged helix-turn-helix domain-containing protein n=1 Tax=Candidatus Lokiarchaeum ossiferum TaxID=2951803 RepID=UPI00352FE838